MRYLVNIYPYVLSFVHDQLRLKARFYDVPFQLSSFTRSYRGSYLFIPTGLLFIMYLDPIPSIEISCFVISC